MEWKSSSLSVQTITYLSCIIFFICQFAVAYPVPEDYEQHDQGMREILAELERQGGLTAPMIPRTYMYRTNPNHQMMRKSQRSNTLRLRFGKRSTATANENDDDDEQQQQLGSIGGGVGVGMFEDQQESKFLQQFQPQQQRFIQSSPNIVAAGHGVQQQLHGHGNGAAGVGGLTKESVVGVVAE